MPAECVVDASVIGAAIFNEVASAEARRFLAKGPHLIAPDLLIVEITSLAAKKVWRNEATDEVGRRALAALGDFIGEFVPAGRLAPRAFALAAAHRFSAYDALYLALAESRSRRLITLDDRMIERAAQARLGNLAGRPADAL
jgi:predicted nucleic acid-binding protein